VVGEEHELSPARTAAKVDPYAVVRYPVSRPDVHADLTIDVDSTVCETSGTPPRAAA
jgi:hypothetical protein